MKKTSVMALLLACGLTAANAQQLENIGFENWKETCGNSEAFGSGGFGTSPQTGEMRQRPGTEPTGWNGSNINQKVVLEKKESGLVTKNTTDPYSGEACAQLTNVFVGVGSIGSTAPGYITFGTPWVYAVSTLSDCNGGTYGGVEFTNRPDAITGMYRRTDSNEETSHIISYLWNGTFQSKVGKAGGPTQTRDNCDLAVLGKITPDQAGTLVAVAESSFTTTDGEWKRITVPFEYKSEEAPTMMNVVISGGNYYSRTALLQGTTLLADDVRFVYYSRLGGLKVNGADVDNFDKDTYNYSVAIPYSSEIAIEPSVLGKEATHTISFDDNNYTATIKVSNVGEDEDGLAEHSYIVQFDEPKTPATPVEVEGGLYKGTVAIYMDEEPTKIEDQIVKITPVSEGVCTFALDNFSLDGETSIGSIVINNVTTTQPDGSTEINYAGSAEDISLAGGEIMADVEIEGTEDADHNLMMNIHVKWIVDPSDKENSMILPIEVTFNGKLTVETGFGIIDVDSDSEARYFLLNGTEVKAPLAKGIYIIRSGNESKKAVIR